MLDTYILNLLFIITPILCYLIYIVYENVMGERVNKLFFDLSIITSIYLITKYSHYFDYDISIIKTLLLVCMLKNRKLLSILISIYISIYFSITYDYNIYLMLIEYFIQLSLFFILIKNNTLRIIIFVILEILCTSSFNIYVVIINICYALLSVLLNILINKGKKIINIYGTVRKIENEKNFRDSLFKITHEIKNPIAVCKGYLDMLDTNNNKQVNKYIPIIKQEIERTLSLMNDFLNLTKLKIEKKHIDIMLLLDDVTTSFEELLIEKNIHFINEINDNEIYIDADYDRLKQVLINILKNSMESIQNNIGIIKLTLKTNKKNLTIKVIDNGIGMDKETLKRVGESFYTTKKNGTGLGIKLSMEIVQLHGGKLKYTSKKDIGTTAVITLPI